MEIVSRPARKTLYKLIELSREDGLIDYSVHYEFLDKNRVWISELKTQKLVKDWNDQSVSVEYPAYHFKARYMTKIYEYQLTGFWLPLAVSVVSSIIINLIIG